jgi:hypothetical protein
MNDKAIEEKKISQLYHLIEFELQKAYTDSYAIKKDNLGFIILLIGLFGLLVYIPIDLFLYDWFFIALLFLIGYSLFFIFISNKFINDENINIRTENQLLSAARDPKLNEKISTFFKDTYNDQIVPFLYVFFVLITCYFITICISYGLSIITPTSSKLKSLYPFNIFFIILLLLQAISIIFIFFKLDYLKKRLEDRNESSFLKFSWPSISLSIFCFVLLIYGMIFKIPPFSTIEANSTYSPEIIELAQSHNELLIVFAIFVYLLLILVIVMDFMISQHLSDQINKKIEKLNEIKSKIDLNLMGISNNLDINDIFKDYLKLKMISPKVFCISGFFWFIIPSSIISTEEKHELFKLLLPIEEFSK